MTTEILGTPDAVDVLLSLDREESRMLDAVLRMQTRLGEIRDEQRKRRAFLSHEESQRYYELRRTR